MNMKERGEMEEDYKIGAFVSAIEDYIKALISESVDEHDLDSMGAYYEEQALKATIKDIGLFKR